jgi:hypothetical protein
MQWLSINDVKRLVKQKMYQLETGSKSGDSLIYDRQSGKYVGHIEGSTQTFHQDSSYIPSRYIIETLETFNGRDKRDWKNKGNGWGSGSTGW